MFILVAYMAFVTAAALAHLTGWRRVACFVLLLSPLLLCGAILRDLSLGIRYLGQAAIDDERKQLGFCLGLFAVSSIAVVRPDRGRTFWIPWTLNAFVCGTLFYIFFFWKVFS